MRFSWAKAAICGVVVGGACKSGSSVSSGCQSTAASAVVQATDAKQFNPTPLQIGQTQSVCWENNGTLTHSVTFDAPDTTDATLAPGYVVIKGFGTTPGDFTYHCKYHSTMTGVIQVR
ncbi:MAG TPA: hypothetical protein VMH88_11985 [Gemmatimonadales bacterium]|nr:hypothetical protein [Gemmatimonadales bacterium]